MLVLVEVGITERLDVRIRKAAHDQIGLPCATMPRPEQQTPPAGVEAVAGSGAAGHNFSNAKNPAGAGCGIYIERDVGIVRGDNGRIRAESGAAVAVIGDENQRCCAYGQFIETTLAMKLKSIGAVAAMAAMAMLRTVPTLADPMLCSGDFYKACISNCAKIANRAAVPACLTNCHVLLSRCKQTGCWDGPTNRYCTLLRK
jgi:hypothetical protein